VRLLVALILAAAALTVAPATASALTCPAGGGALAELHTSDAAFVGQVVEHREDSRVMSVPEGFKGVSTGDTVEIGLPDNAMVPPVALSQRVLGTVAPEPPIAVVANVRDGRLAQGLCRFVTVDGLRAAAAADRQGLRCDPPPRIVWAVATITGRLLSLRVVVADQRRRTNTVRVDWGHFFGVRQNAVTTTRVPRSRTLLLRHRYRRSGDVEVRVTVTSPAMLPSSLCSTAPRSSRTLPVRIPGRTR
jgi:hypothetical protein